MSSQLLQHEWKSVSKTGQLHRNCVFSKGGQLFVSFLTYSIHGKTESFGPSQNSVSMATARFLRGTGKKLSLPPSNSYCLWDTVSTIPLSLQGDETETAQKKKWMKILQVCGTKIWQLSPHIWCWWCVGKTFLPPSITKKYYLLIFSAIIYQL